MSRKATRVPPASIEGEEQHPDPTLQSLLEKIPDAYSITIRKMHQGKWKFQRTVQPDAIGPVLEDFIQRHFGGGTFQVLLTDSNGRLMTSRGGIEIEELPESERPKVVAVDEEPPAAVGIVKRNGGTFNDLIEVMREENNRMHSLMIEMIRARSDSGGGSSVSELVAALAQLKRLEPPPAAAPPAFDQIFMKGVEFAHKANGGAGGSEDSFMSIVREVLTMAKPMIEKMAAPAAAAAAVPAGDPAAPAGGEGETVEEQIDIGPALDYLKAKFRQGTSTAVLGEIIIDQMQGNADYTQLLLHIASQPVEEFLALDDEFAAEPFRQAAVNLHAELKRRLIPEVQK